MSLPRIGFVWNTPGKSGERCIRRQVLGSKSFSPIVLTARNAPAAPDFPVPVLRVSTPRNPWKKLWRKYLLRQPRATYNQEHERLLVMTGKLGIRLVHVFFGTKGIKYRQSLRRLDIPVSVSFHGSDVSECAQRADLAPHLPELFVLVSCVMARSDFMARTLVDLGCPPSKLWINRSGIPLDDYPYLDRAGRTSARFTFIHAGRLIPKKGLGVTIDAFARVVRELPTSRLWIAGEGPQRAELETQVERLHLAPFVRFLGFLPTPALVRRLHDADLFVHPSLTTSTGEQEGIPNSMLEAMATGLAPLTTRHAGIPEAVREGDNGWLVAEGDAQELAERMLACARDPDAVAAAGRAARAFVEREHALDERLRLLDEKYGELIATRDSRSGPVWPAERNAS